MVYTAPSGARHLLRRINTIMQEKSVPQERLQKIVVQIAQAMVAEVCSLYVLNKDGALILLATEGLKSEAVGNVILNHQCRYNYTLR